MGTTDGKNVFQLVGRFLIMFARLEMSLTHITAVIFDHAGGQRGKKWKAFPGRMGQRKTFLEESFSELSVLAPYRADWAIIQTGMERPEAVRHGIVHGVWDGEIGPPPAGALIFRRMAPDGSPKMEILSTSVAELDNVDSTVIDLARRASELSSRIDKAFVPQ